ncbi:MAG: polyphosphate polymerase domain-containing protein [Rhodospirillaceae bacterium]|nr:polyphosphate polymerase domain-containing protein [Rhodospirillaceae bacterium]MBT7955205.1 polyphosphate polymerase domain-containing protein [Rhodospirillaceae bacterium]
MKPNLISRFEIKYQLNYLQRKAFFDRISGILTPDIHNREVNGYGNYSIYYDSPGQRYSNEKEEGLALRTKPRLRIYKRLSDLEPVAYFFELKHRIDSRVAKERVAIGMEDAKILLDPTYLDEKNIEVQSPVLSKFYYLARRFDLRPVLCVFYHRQAFTSEHFPGLRITFDSFVSGCARTVLDNKPNNFTPILPHNNSIVEVKYNDRVPNWISQVVNCLEMQQVSVSKYATAADILAGHGAQSLIHP